MSTASQAASPLRDRVYRLLADWAEIAPESLHDDLLLSDAADWRRMHEDEREHGFLIRYAEEFQIEHPRWDFDAFWPGPAWLAPLMRVVWRYGLLYPDVEISKIDLSRLTLGDLVRCAEARRWDGGFRGWDGGAMGRAQT